MDRKFPSDGSPSPDLSFTATSAAANTVAIQVVDGYGNSVPGQYAFLVTGDAVNEDIDFGDAAEVGTNYTIAAHGAAVVASRLIVTDINGAFSTNDAGAFGLNITFLATGLVKALEVTAP